MKNEELKKMKRMMERNVVLKDVRMDTQTVFLTSGDILIYPSPWEADKAPVTAGGRASYRGRIRVEEDGSTRVTRYNTGLQGPLYTLLFETEHCQVMRTPRGKIIERWSFPPTFTADDIRSARDTEGYAIDAFYASRRLETKW